MGLAQDRRRALRDPRFVSFMSQSNRKTLDTDFHDTVMRGRRLLRQGLVVVAAAAFAWVAIESARALSIF